MDGDVSLAQLAAMTGDDGLTLSDVGASYGNPMLMKQLAKQRAANKRPNVTDVLGYGLDWSSYLSNLSRNFAGQFEGLGTPQNFMGPFGFGGITAFHGSPHKFDKFDMSKIGTGEGAQAYGHGLYFAENPGVARTYAADRAYVGQAMSGKPAAINYDDPAWIAQKTIDELGDPAKAKAHLEMVARTAAKHQTPESSAAVNGAIDLIASGAVKPKGALYKVDLPDDQVAKMLDWDKPLSQQPEVLAELNKIADSLPVNMVVDTASGRRVNSRLKGSEFYNQIAGTPHALAALGPKGAGPTKAVQTPNGLALVPDNPSGQAAASNYLRSLGIPGIRYLDQGSRSGGKGTSNFVVFDDQIPKIVGRE
jgi:hypothetical protein